jgi:hypothetical protein
LQGAKSIAYSDDGNIFYLIDLADRVWEITRWDRRTQQETLVVPGPQSPLQIEVVPSFDGRRLFRVVHGDSLSVRSMPDGDWKTLVSGAKGLSVTYDTSRDGNWAFYYAYDATGKSGLFRVPISGGEPQRLGDLPSETFHGNFYFRPDGRQILGIDFNYKYDMWVQENFEPSVKK